MWSEFGRDIRLIKKYFRRHMSRRVKSDFIFNVIGLGLVASLGLSMVLQRDILKEGFELASPFQYDSPKSIYYVVYRALVAPVPVEGEEDRDVTPNDVKFGKTIRFPDRNSIAVIEQKSEEGSSA